MGTEVGELARSRFPGGVLVAAGYRQTEAALAQTAELDTDLTVPAIFEAAFLHGGVLIRADVLERVQAAEGQPSGWRLIEVKSSTKIKDVHLEDLAVQSEVILSAGLTLVSVSLMHINTGYLYRDGPIDLTELFAIQDLSEAVAQRRASVPERLATMNRMLLHTQPLTLSRTGIVIHPTSARSGNIAPKTNRRVGFITCRGRNTWSAN